MKKKCRANRPTGLLCSLEMCNNIRTSLNRYLSLISGEEFYH